MGGCLAGSTHSSATLQSPPKIHCLTESFFGFLSPLSGVGGVCSCLPSKTQTTDVPFSQVYSNDSWNCSFEVIWQLCVESQSLSNCLPKQRHHFTLPLTNWGTHFPHTDPHLVTACFDFHFSHPRERELAIVVFICISLLIYSVKHHIGCFIYSSGKCPLRTSVCFKNELSELCFFVCMCMCMCVCTHVHVGAEVKGQTGFLFQHVCPGTEYN